MKICVYFFAVILSVFSNEEQIAFPELPKQKLDSDNTTERVPLFAPKKCPKDQLLFPGNQKDDWICDCRLGFIYYPLTDTCYHAYKRGPCQPGQHLILKAGKVVPECVKNPCAEGFAKYFNGICYEMGKPNGPCGDFEAGGGIYDVNATTLVVECLKGTDRLSLLRLNCPPGSIRNCYNKCVNL